MYHFGQMVKEWRSLLRNLKKQYPQPQAGGANVAELELRFGKLDQGSFESGAEAGDFQALARKFMHMFQQGKSTSSQLATPAATFKKTDEEKESMDAKHAEKPASLLGRITRIEEWHFEDILYEGGFRTRQAKLVSSLSSLPGPSGPNTATDRKNSQNQTPSDSKTPPSDAKTTMPPAATTAPGAVTTSAAAAAGAKAAVNAAGAGSGASAVSGVSTSECVQKSKISWCDVMALQRKYDCRFCLKFERAVPSSAVQNLRAESRRMQTRRCFWIENYIRIDMSIVQQQHFSRSSALASSKTNPTTVTHEIEIEILPEGADIISDQQLVAHLRNWVLEILDSFGKIEGCEALDGPLLVLQLGPNQNSMDRLPNSLDRLPNSTLPNSTKLSAQDKPVPAPATVTSTQRAICTDVLLVPINRSICRARMTT